MPLGLRPGQACRAGIPSGGTGRGTARGGRARRERAVQESLMGREPDGLSLEKLYRLPVLWEEQRGALEDSR